MAQAAIVSTLTDKFTSMIVDKLFQEVSLVTTFRKDFQFLCNELNSIKDMLRDAGLLTDARDERISSSMSNWLDKVEEFVTDAQYIVEECAAAGNLKFRNPIFRYKMGRRIQGLKDRISQFQWSSKHVKNFESVLAVNDRFQRSNISEDKEISDPVTERSPVGMEKEIEQITLLILKVDDPRVIAIVGMGGSGKTLLLHLVFTHQKILEAGFDYRVWLPVSRTFDLPSLLRLIIKQIKCSDLKNVRDFDESELRDKIIERLEGKRCLFAIDDVWQQGVVENLGLKRLKSQIKIVITTRQRKVAENYEIVELRHLSKENSWKLFCIHAFADRENHDPPEGLETLARKIEEKCRGVPLALKTIGGYMAKVRSIPNDWLSTLQHLEAEHLQAEAMSSIKPCLKLSYQVLPYHLKPCFLYFSVFPNNAEIDTDRLVYAWISEGFVPTREDAYNVGCSYISELLDRCLIEGLEVGGDGRVRLCKMHDFLHDLADSVEQPKCLLKPGGQLNEIPVDKLPEEDRLHLCRISLIKNEISKINGALHCPRLRTLLLSDNGKLHSISESFFNNLEYLSVLDLSMTSIGSLPGSVGRLHHLKFLNLSGTKIKKLPESLSDLKRLLFLDVSNCGKLEHLHWGIGKHRFMLHLNVEGCEMLEWLPVGISKLVSLRTLKGVKLESENAANNNSLQSGDNKNPENVASAKASQSGDREKLGELENAENENASQSGDNENAENANASQSADCTKPEGVREGKSKLLSLPMLKCVNCKSKNAANARALKLEDLKALTLLEQLSINIDADPPKGIFGGMKKMRTLSCLNSSLENLVSLPGDMDAMECLEIVRLNKCAVPKWLFQLKNLMELELRGHHKCPTEDYKELADIPNLKKLHLSKFSDFPEEFGRSKAFPKLEELILELIDFNKFPLEKDAMPKLKHLQLQACPYQPDDHLLQFLKERRVPMTILDKKQVIQKNGEKSLTEMIVDLDSDSSGEGTGTDLDKKQSKNGEESLTEVIIDLDSDSSGKGTGTDHVYKEVQIQIQMGK